MDKNNEQNIEDEKLNAQLLEDSEELLDKVNFTDKINPVYSGFILKLGENSAKTRFQTTSDMALDDAGVVHAGFLFMAASYAGKLAVNEEFINLIGNKMNFLVPTKIGDVIDFEATSFFNDSKKREVQVFGYINEIKILEGSLQIVVLEDHVFNLQKKEKEKQKNRKEIKSEANEKK